jgi:hypothetical protein
MLFALFLPEIITVMQKEIPKISLKDLFLKGLLSYFVIGILVSIGIDKEILSYFLSLKTIVRILLFTICGGVLNVFVMTGLRKLLSRRDKKSESTT